MTSHLSRRTFMAQSSAAAAGSLLSMAGIGVVGALTAPEARAQHASTAVDASAAGQFLIGGQSPVNRLGFGAMRVTGDGIWGEPDNPKEALAVLKRAVEFGTNFIDTADAYGPFVSERLICEALYPYPHGLMIATKGGQIRPSRQEWVPNGQPKHLREACEASLARLKVERIDLYQLHRPDPQVPYEDSVGELAKLQQEGKIRYVGVSNVNVEQLGKARAIVKVVSVQNLYNVSDRSSDDVLAICEREKIAFIPWGPLAQRAQQNSTPPKSLLALQAIATKRNIDINEAALAWLLARSPVMLPIPGTSKVAHLEDNVGAAAIRLSPQEMAQVG